MRKNIRKGFTIVELVIVIAVIAVLATVLVPTFGNIIEKANASKTLQELRNEYTEYTIAVDGAIKDTIIIKLDGNFYSFTNGESNFTSTTEPTTPGDTYWDGEKVVTVSAVDE